MNRSDENVTVCRDIVDQLANQIIPACTHWRELGGGRDEERKGGGEQVATRTTRNKAVKVLARLFEGVSPQESPQSGATNQ